jgi:hypothetical protein
MRDLQLAFRLGSRIRRRRSTPDQDIRAQVSAVWPDYRAALNPDPCKQLRLLSNLFEDRADQQRAHLAFDCRAVSQSEPEALT